MSDTTPHSPVQAGAQNAHPLNWQWWAGEAELNHKDEWVHPELYGTNEPSRAATIAAAQREFPGVPIALVEATFDGPFECNVFDDENLTGEIWEVFLDSNSDRWGEDGCLERPSDEALAEAMNAAFKAFITAHYKDFNPRIFTGTRNAEIIMPDAEGSQ